MNQTDLDLNQTRLEVGWNQIQLVPPGSPGWNQIQLVPPGWNQIKLYEKFELRS